MAFKVSNIFDGPIVSLLLPTYTSGRTILLSYEFHPLAESYHVGLKLLREALS